MRSRLFDQSFQQFRGLSLDQALQGYQFSYDHNRVLHPDEVDEIRQRFRRGGPPTAEQAAEVAGQHRPIGDVVHDWTMNTRDIMVGTHTVAIARDLIDLGNEIESSSRPTERKTYRGANLEPAQQVARRPDMPLSFTEDQHVARSFAKGGGGRGSIFHAQAGSMSGIFVPDYVPRERTIGQGRRPEREWLINPRSITS